MEVDIRGTNKDLEHISQLIIAGLIPLLVQIFQDRFKAGHLTCLREVTEKGFQLRVIHGDDALGLCFQTFKVWLQTIQGKVETVAFGGDGTNAGESFRLST